MIIKQHKEIIEFLQERMGVIPTKKELLDYFDFIYQRIQAEGHFDSDELMETLDEPEDRNWPFSELEYRKRLEENGPGIIEDLVECQKQNRLRWELE